MHRAQRLYFGPYRTPRFKVGQMLQCAIRGKVAIYGVSQGRIPWPLWRVAIRPSLVLCAGLVEAVRKESRVAVAHWWGVFHLSLDQLCFSRSWEESLVRSFVVAACLPKKGYLARVILEGSEVIAYAFASQHEGQLLVERLGVRPENRRQGIGSGLMVSLILAARNWKLPVITCSVDEENLGGQLFLKVGGFKALPVTDETRREKVIQFARSEKG